MVNYRVKGKLLRRRPLNGVCAEHRPVAIVPKYNSATSRNVESLASSNGVRVIRSVRLMLGEHAMATVARKSSALIG
jgi:hypothetical protein